MGARSVVKIIFLVVATVLAIVVLLIGRIIMRGKKYSGNSETYNVRKVLRIRMICFLVMLVLLLICFVI